MLVLSRLCAHPARAMIAGLCCNRFCHRVEALPVFAQVDALESRVLRNEGSGRRVQGGRQAVVAQAQNDQGLVHGHGGKEGASSNISQLQTTAEALRLCCVLVVAAA